MTREVNPALLSWLGQGLAAQGRGATGMAILAYRKVLNLDPDQGDALCNLSGLLRGLGRFQEAMDLATRATAVDPGAALGHMNLGLALQSLGQLEAALEALERARRLAPDNPVVLSNLAGILHALGRDQEALALDREALELDPGMLDLRMNVGYALMRVGDLEAARTCLEEVLARDSGHAKARWNLAYTHLLRGEPAFAWPHFSARLETPEARENLRDYPQPLWDGQPFPGRTLLVWGEQGFGDAFMVVRFLPRLQAMGGKVVVLTYAQGLEVLRTAAPEVAWHSEGEALPPFDLQIPMLDLLPRLTSEGSEVLGQGPYLQVPSRHEPPEAMRALLAHAEGRKVGLVWAGNPNHVEDRRRSMDPACLEPLSVLEGIRWFSLQVGPSRLPPLPGLVELGPLIRNFADTAWILGELEALVSVDTSVAHLAGALGRPVHLLLPFFPDWRWGWQGSRTPWYASMTLHRQGSPGAWGPVVESVARGLG